MSKIDEVYRNRRMTMEKQIYLQTDSGTFPLDPNYFKGINWQNFKYGDSIYFDIMGCQETARFEAENEHGIFLYTEKDYEQRFGILRRNNENL